MFAAEATVRTDRAARYLAQLCAHADRMAALGAGRHAPAAGRPTSDPADEHTGVVDLDGARCTLSVAADTLTLHGESEDADRLARLQQRLTTTLERIGRRDRLVVAWTPVPADGAALLDALLAPQGRANPYPLYARAHRLGPLAPVGAGYLLVSGYDAVDEVLRDPGFGMAEPAADPAAAGTLRSMSRSILRVNPPDHGRMRSLISQVFTPRRVAGLRPAVEAAVERLLDRLAATAARSGAVDFVDGFAYRLPVTVIGELLGVPEADRDRFRPLAADLTEALELSEDLSAAADAAARELAGYFAALVAERRARPTDDLIGALVTARDAGEERLSEEELLANLILLLVAGFETTTSLLGNGLAVLLDDPPLAERVRSAETPVAAFVEEVLRFDPPVQVTTRLARADRLTVAGRPVPRGTRVIALIGAANRDPRRYRDPDRFDATRADTRPLSFGAGAHICLGNSLARLEAAVAFPRVLARFPRISADPDAVATRRDRLVLRGHHTLPIRLG